MRPLARRDSLVIRDLAGEMLVYDRERHQAHCLNPAAASVFRLCDGERSTQDIAAQLEGSGGATAREAVVKLAVEQLAAAQLLVAGDEPRGTSAPAHAASATSRRELLRLAALTLPAIASIVAPTPAQAASACITETECMNDPVVNANKVCDTGSGCNPVICCNGVTGLCDTTCP